ncbi:MAG: hypothetical protein RBS39_03150 [Phycisphaerales bacterium]|nr:hypothetical protein [Phycisphaerales bacterium]
MLIAQSIVAAFLLYVLMGVVVATLFHARGLARVDPTTRGAGWAFRAIITPGLIALWPWVCVAWKRRASGPASDGARVSQGTHTEGGA